MTESAQILMLTNHSMHSLIAMGPIPPLGFPRAMRLFEWSRCERGTAPESLPLTNPRNVSLARSLKRRTGRIYSYVQPESHADFPVGRRYRIPKNATASKCAVDACTASSGSGGGTAGWIAYSCLKR